MTVLALSESLNSLTPMSEGSPNPNQPMAASDIVRAFSAQSADADQGGTDKPRVTTEMLRSLIDHLPFEVFAVGSDGRYLFQNAICRAHWGEISGKLPEQVSRNSSDFLVWRENNRRAFAGEIVEGEMMMLVEGEERIFYNLLAPMRDQGQVRAILGINVDITERKRKEAVLQAANAALQQDVQQRAAELEQINSELQAIYEGIADGLLVADSETMRFLRTNAEMCRMLGYSEEELLELSIPDIHRPEDLPSVRESLQYLSEKQIILTRTREVLRRDGSTFYADIRSSRFLYKGQLCLVAIFRDATERVEYERSLTRDRHVLRNLLAASDRDRQEISYAIHDGLTQQLGGAIMHFQASESLQATAPEQAQQMQQHGIRLLQEAMGEARRLIDAVRPPLLDDAGVVPALERLVRETNERGNSQVEFHCDVDSGRLEPVLENAIYRIIQEALMNASRFSQSQRIQISLVERDESLQIEVRDWGVGFDTASVPSECFGLESIRERVRLLGGKSDIESQPGQGATVRVELPLLIRESQ